MFSSGSSSSIMVIVITVIGIIMLVVSVSVTGSLICADYLGQHGQVYKTTSTARAVAIMNDVGYVIQRYPSR